MLYGCAGIPLKDYEPGSADEQEIIEVIKKMTAGLSQKKHAFELSDSLA